MAVPAVLGIFTFEDEQMHAENAGKSSDPPQQRTKLKAKWGLIKRDQSFGGGCNFIFFLDNLNSFNLSLKIGKALWVCFVRDSHGYIEAN